MLKDIKPFLPLYTGCYVRVTTKEARFDAVLSGVFFDRWHSSSKRHELTVQVALGEDCYHYYKLNQAQLLLRPLSDMTKKEEFTYMDNSKWGPYTPIEFKRLLLEGFDLFGLIESGLAIDITKEVRHGQ